MNIYDNTLDITSGYWNIRAEGYSRTINDELDNNEDAFWRRVFNNHAPVEYAPKALDVGCGPGFFSIILSDMGYDVTAIDITENMLEKARENVKKAGGEVRFFKMDATQPDFEDESFDLIVTRNVTWNLPDPEKAYREWMRILKPGGTLINEDGNHYLYSCDPDYEWYRSTRQESGHKYMEGIDTTPIDRLGCSMPLAGFERPMWDIKTALQLGARNVHTIVRNDAYTEGEKRRLFLKFVVLVDK